MALPAKQSTTLETLALRRLDVTDVSFVGLYMSGTGVKRGKKLESNYGEGWGE